MEKNIPKKIHYCWFGRGEKPKKALDCIESWKKYCPDYELIEWNEYKPSKLKMFLSREFLSFLIVGGINTVSNVIFSTIYSLFIPNTTLAFFPGYITSNVVSYLLNSKLTFKDRLGFVKFI